MKTAKFAGADLQKTQDLAVAGLPICWRGFRVPGMTRTRFPLSSDQLELLLAFEQCQGLGRVAEQMGRDPSVISRNLQRMAEGWPVLAKVNGRWELTALGRQINRGTQDFVVAQEKLLQASRKKEKSVEPCHSPTALLMIINAQKALHDVTAGRSNTGAEGNIASLLQTWRREKKPLLHVKHVSENPRSSFYKDAEACQFLAPLTPMNDEAILEKTKSSAFINTDLNDRLQRQGIDTLILTGFTANDCIDSTARQAADLGFTTYVVGDATAMFDISGTDGKLIKAERLQQLTLANLNALCAKVIETAFLL